MTTDSTLASDIAFPETVVAERVQADRCTSMPGKGPISIALPPDQASGHTVNVLAHTDIIGGSWMSTTYATELLRVDPRAPLREGCLAVIKFSGGGTFMARYTSCGHDGNGRFCKRGSPEEMVHFGPVYMRREQINGDIIELVGRVVGCDREFPRPAPATYNRH